MEQNIFQIIRRGELTELRNAIKNLDINLVNEEKQNMLHEAVAFERNLQFDFLISLNIDVNAQDENGQTPLHYCANKGLVEFAKKILDAGGNQLISDKYGNQPLWTAAFNARGRYELVQLFMKYSADPNHKNLVKKSPLDFAIQIEDDELIAILNE